MPDAGPTPDPDLVVVRAEVDEVEGLRARVLRAGSGLSALRYEEDDDPRTATFAATSAGSPDAGPAGAATVFPAPCPWRPGLEGTWRLRAMATDERHRGRGIGSAVLIAAVDHVTSEGGRLLWCDARVAARPFYERHGFTVEGEGYDIEGIGPHWPMARPLDGA